MDAVELLEEAKRYCKWCKNTTQDGKRRLCEACYFEKLNEIFNTPPMAYRKFVETVEEWSKEHPVKTRQSVFLAQWPNCMVDNDGTVGMCPRNVDKNYICDISRFAGCLDCRRWFWMQEVE